MARLVGLRKRSKWSYFARYYPEYVVSLYVFACDSLFPTIMSFIFIGQLDNNLEVLNGTRWYVVHTYQGRNLKFINTLLN